MVPSHRFAYFLSLVQGLLKRDRENCMGVWLRGLVGTLSVQLQYILLFGHFFFYTYDRSTISEFDGYVGLERRSFPSQLYTQVWLGII